MTKFMATINLAEPDDEFHALISHQRVHMNRLMAKGTVVHFALAADRRKAWVTVVAADEGEAISILESFPLQKYMDFGVTELGFQESVTWGFREVSLN